MVERMMKKVTKMRVKRGKAAQLQVLGLDQKMMEVEWWMEGGLTGPGEGWRLVMMAQLEGKWMGVERCLQLQVVGRRAAALREDKWHSPLPAGWAVGRAR